MAKTINMNNPGMKRENAGLNVNIKPSDLTDVVCEKCGEQTFEPVFLFKSISAVLSPTGKESLIPLQVYRCTECKHINSGFLPKENPNE